MRKSVSISIVSLLVVLTLAAILGRSRDQRDSYDHKAAKLPPNSIVVLRSGQGTQGYDLLRPELASSVVDIAGTWVTARRGAISKQDWQELLDSLPSGLAEMKPVLAQDTNTGLQMAYEESSRVLLIRSDAQTLGVVIHPHHIYREKTFEKFNRRLGQIEETMELIPEGQSGIVFTPPREWDKQESLRPLPEELAAISREGIVPYLWVPVPQKLASSGSEPSLHDTSGGWMRAGAYSVSYPPWLKVTSPSPHQR